MPTLNRPSRARTHRAAILIVVIWPLIGACDIDLQSNCSVVSNAAARDAANGFEVRHESPQRCPVDVPASGGRTVLYSAEVNVLSGRQTNALALDIYDANDQFIIGGDCPWDEDPNDGSRLRSFPEGNYTAGRVAPRFGVSLRDIADNAVPLVNGQTALGSVYLPYITPTLMFTTSDAYVDQLFSATVNHVGPEPTWPATYEWKLDDAPAGSGQSFETLPCDP